MSKFFGSRAAKAFAIVALTGSAFGVGVAVADQPHMFNALRALQNARHELEVATADKGGHRVQAINLIDQAINQVQLGIDAGR
jgi:hypothetical protein